MNFSDDAEDGNTQPTLDAAEQVRLGRKLQEVYAEVIEEPVPDRFLNLLAQLEASEKKKGSS